MGGSSSALRLFANQPSEAEPGSLCISTGSSFGLLNPPMTLEEAFEEFELFMRYPVSPGGEWDAMMKQVDFAWHGPNDFAIKITLDGKKLDAAGKGRGDETDKIVLWCRYLLVSIGVESPLGALKRTFRSNYVHFVDASAGGAWADEVVAEPEVLSRIAVYGLRDPDRIEICIDLQDGTRDASEARVGLNRVICETVGDSWRRARAATVQVFAGRPGKREPGTLSSMSQPMDEHISYEHLLDCMVATLQAEIGCCNIDTSETKFSGEAVRHYMGRCKIRSEVTVSKETGEMSIFEIAVAEDGKPAWPAWSRVSFCVIHQSPLIFEGWDVDAEGVHMTNPYLARRMQIWINASIDRASNVFAPVHDILREFTQWSGFEMSTALSDPTDHAAV